MANLKSQCGGVFSKLTEQDSRCGSLIRIGDIRAVRVDTHVVQGVTAEKLVPIVQVVHLHWKLPNQDFQLYDQDKS